MFKNPYHLHYSDVCNMATGRQIESNTVLRQFRSCELQTNDKCLNCVKMKEQLDSAIQDLKTAGTIITMLSAELKLNSEPTASGGPNLNGAKWSVIKYKNSEYNCGTTRYIKNFKCNSVTSNRFAPLDTIVEQQPEELTTNNKDQQTMSTRQRDCGLKIPTIVNGVIDSSRTKKPPKAKNSVIPPMKTQNGKSSRYVRIIGDSHLKGSVAKLKYHLNSYFNVSSIIKPGAKINQLLHDQENELKLLGKKDLLIISTGANDLETPTKNINNSIVPLIKFINKLEQINVIVVSIPCCYDLGQDPCSISIKRKILRYSEKLHNLKIYPHVSIIELSPDRDHYTKHGLHLNNFGKEEVVKQIVKQIGLDKWTDNSSEAPLPLQWRDLPIEGEVSTN